MIDYRITNSDYVMHCIYLSDWLSVSAYICCLISVIGISAKSCISAPLLYNHVYAYKWTYATHGDILAGLDSGTRSVLVLDLVSK